VINVYSSEPAANQGGGRGRSGAGDSEDADAPAGGGRGRGAATPTVSKQKGLNRLVWDVRNQAGVMVPPDAYQARLKVGETLRTEPFNVLIDPNVAADGVTLADLQEQFEHNTRTRQLMNDASQLVTRVREAQAALRGSGGTTSEKARALDGVAGQLLTQPVRYGKPGLQAQITYLASMTTVADQKIGRDALEQYDVLRKDLERLRGEVERILR